MAQINLLPWRQQRRVELKKQFFIVLGIMIFSGLAVVIGATHYVRYEIVEQNLRNDLIKKGQSSLEQDIETITKLEKERAQLVERLHVIQDLQGRRSIIVHQFDELVRIVPEGVYLTKVIKTKDRFEIEGVSESNNRISFLMRNFSHSIWFRSPVLSAVEAADKNNANASSHFKLSVFENIPDKEAIESSLAAVPVSENGS